MYIQFDTSIGADSESQCLLLTRVACVSDTMLPTAAVEPSWFFSWDSRFWFEN